MCLLSIRVVGTGSAKIFFGCVFSGRNPLLASFVVAQAIGLASKASHCTGPLFHSKNRGIDHRRILNDAAEPVAVHLILFYLCVIWPEQAGSWIDKWYTWSVVFYKYLTFQVDVKKLGSSGRFRAAVFRLVVESRFNLGAIEKLDGFSRPIS